MRFTQTNWNFYRAFILAYETGSINKAAEALGSKRENTGKSIKALERSLGIKLFTSSTRGVRPTTAAAELYAKVEPLLSLISFHEKNLGEFDKDSHAVIRLAMPSTFANFYSFRKYLQQFCDEYKNVKFVYYKKDNKLLENKQIDCIIRAGSFLDKHKFTVNKLFSANLNFIASKKYIERKKILPSITIAQLDELDIIGQTDLLNALHSNTGIKLAPRISTATHEQIYPLVRDGFGIGLCFESAFDENEDIVRLSVADFEFKEDVYLAHNSGFLTQVSKIFVKGLIKHYKNLYPE